MDQINQARRVFDNDSGVVPAVVFEIESTDNNNVAEQANVDANYLIDRANAIIAMAASPVRTVGGNRVRHKVLWSVQCVDAGGMDRSFTLVRDWESNEFQMQGTGNYRIFTTTGGANITVSRSGGNRINLSVSSRYSYTADDDNVVLVKLNATTGPARKLVTVTPVTDDEEAPWTCLSWKLALKLALDTRPAGIRVSHPRATRGLLHFYDDDVRFRFYLRSPRTNADVGHNDVTLDLFRFLRAHDPQAQWYIDVRHSCDDGTVTFDDDIAEPVVAIEDGPAGHTVTMTTNTWRVLFDIQHSLIRVFDKDDTPANHECILLTVDVRDQGSDKGVVKGLFDKAVPVPGGGGHMWPRHVVRSIVGYQDDHVVQQIAAGAANKELRRMARDVLFDRERARRREPAVNDFCNFM